MGWQKQQQQKLLPQSLNPQSRDECRLCCVAAPRRKPAVLPLTAPNPMNRRSLGAPPWRLKPQLKVSEQHQDPHWASLHPQRVALCSLHTAAAHPGVLHTFLLYSSCIGYCECVCYYYIVAVVYIHVCHVCMQLTGVNMYVQPNMSNLNRLLVVYHVCVSLPFDHLWGIFPRLKPRC